MGRSHKETNTYRFQNFTERMKVTHIDVVHQVHKKTEESGERSTYFGDALSKWVDLNCTQNFLDFQDDMCKFSCNSYVQLVHHAEDIVITLKKHLLIDNTLALEPLLDLVVQMGRDMGPDFYPHFESVFEILVQLLKMNSKDPDCLEKVFVTMAFLYKFLWRYLAQNIQSVYRYFSALLTENNKDYIQRFAAESFAFLMRKVKDQDALLNFLFMDLEQNPEKAKGVGQLLFEMMKGVKERFHTISGQVFQSILLRLGSQSSGSKSEGCELPVALVEETIINLMGACAAYTNREHAAHLWTVLLDTLTEVHKSCHDHKTKESLLRSDRCRHLCRLLRTADVWLVHEKGSIVSDPPAVAKVLCAILKELPQGGGTESLATDILTVTSSLLLYSSNRLSVEVTAKLVASVFAVDFALNDVKTMTLSLFTSPLFEKDVLPGLLSFLCRHFSSALPEVRREMVSMVADIVLRKQSLPEDGDDLNKLICYTLDFGRVARGGKSAFVQHVLSVVESSQRSVPSDSFGKEELSELLSSLVCLPHIGTLDASKSSMAIVTAWQALKSHLSQCAEELKGGVLYVMHQAILSLLVLRADVDVLDFLPAEDVLTLLRTHPDSYFVVHATDLYLTLMFDLDKNDLFTPERLVELYPLLEPNLVSCSPKKRRSTLHLLTLYPVTMATHPPQQEEMQDEKIWTIFTAAFEAEKVPLSVRDYRQRLVYLRKMDHSIVHTIMPAGPFSKMPTLYLVGTLFCPLTLLWDPVCELIASHAKGMDKEDFWTPFSHWLNFAAAKAVEKPVVQEEASTETLVEKWILKEQGSERMPDYSSFRNLLWRAMSLFPEKCEPRSRDVVPLFLDFLQKEYYKADLSVAPSQDIRMGSSAEEADNEGQNDTMMEEEEEEEKTPAKADFSGKGQKKSAVQVLLVHLELFAKMQNPRSLYKEAELRDIFFQFLEHRNSRVQKVAFQCIMTYKYKFLTPYRENFERLLDDKTFKTEVVLFSVDEESTEIKQEHRQELLPYLMRILYGKMLSKAGTETSGKRRSDVRRSIVFRFLAGCSSTEMQYFLNLVFGPLKQFITDSPLEMVKMASALDLRNVVPPKRMKGVLGTVLVVTEKLGHLLHDNARSVLHLLLGVAATCAACLQHRATIKPSAATILKSVRQMAYNRLIQFFGEFDKFEFTKQESDAILGAFVRPQLDRLSIESKCQPSLLLKLMTTWCQDPRHFHFLTTEETQSGVSSPLGAMFSLLTSPGVSRSVSNVILTAVESLLEGEEEHIEEPPQKRRKTVKETEIGEGVLMVQRYVPDLLTFIEGTISNLGEQLSNAKKTGVSKETLLELKILSRISMYIEDGAQSVRLCSLLMPLLGSGLSLQQELEESTLESVLNLMKMVKDTRPFFRPVIPLFLSIERRQSRVVLCQILKAIGSKTPELEEISDFVEKLNAWNPRQAEEPDYTLRVDTFRLVVQHVKDWEELDVDFFLPLLYNCCFFIRTFEDLSLRDNSTLCMVTLVQRFKALTSDPGLYKEIIAGTILPVVKKGFRSKQESVRHEFLSIFQALVAAFPDHREFMGLSGLKDTDLESDFFENIKHIQIHKQAKALRRLSHYLHSHKLRADQHMGFFVPLLYFYVLDKRYAKSGKIIDASVDLMCMICRQLPWENYYQLLRLYLTHLPRYLDTQRILIKVIVAILDGFHFDLSQSQFQFSSKPKLVQQSENGETKDEDQTLAILGSEEIGAEKTPEEKLAEDAEEVLSTLVATASKQKEDEVQTKGVEFSADRKDLCAPGLATRIHRMMLQSLIPQLHKTLTEKAKSDDIHKLAQTKYAEDEEILRVPIAMAMIKLLQKLPDQALRHKLPGIILRVCNFLKSRAQDIRMTARDTLVKALQTIGARYLPFVIKEMRAVLTRGYQLHVLSFSVHHVLKCLADSLKPGDLDPALDDLQAIFMEELFGSVSEEKGVEGITSKLFEAKTIKGYLAFKVMAQLISPDYLGTLVQPLKMKLEGTHSQTVANKVRIALQNINGGLLSNKALTIKTMMLFVHSLTADNLSLLREKKETPESAFDKMGKPKKPESCLLLPKVIPRGGLKPKTHKKTTLDVLVEFGLVLLHSCLKNGSLKPDCAEHLSFLEPLVPSLVECLSVKYVKVNSAALRCFEWLLTFPLPTVKKKITAIARQLFILLKNYASAGAAKGDNQDLVFTCFKTVTVLVRDVKYHKLTPEHLQVLLLFCEEDIYDHTRQSTAFSVLKAILRRRLNVPELHELLSSVQTMSITAEAQHVRAQCREVVLQYLKDYPLGKKIVKHLEFYVKQLQYELEDGRMSALKVLRNIFTTFDEAILQKYSGLFFIPLSMCLFSDESTACREMASETMKVFLEKIDVDSRDKLFSIVLDWIADEKVILWSVAVHLCGIFVEVETTNFITHRQDVFAQLLQKDVPPEGPDNNDQERDQFLFQLMVMIKKVLTVIDVPRLSSWTDFNKLLDYIQDHLLDQHTWIRLLACQLMGQVFRSVGHADITTWFKPDKAKQLVHNLCTQLQSHILDETLASEVVKNMVFIAKAYHTPDAEDGSKAITVLWLAKKLIKEANYEKISNPQVSLKRNYVFKWIAAISQEFDADAVTSILPSVLPALQRETEGFTKDEMLRDLSQEVMDLLKKKTGVEAFSSVYTSAQKARSEKKEKRKQKRAIAAVNNPEITAAKKMRKNKNRKKAVHEDRLKRVKKTKLTVFEHKN